MNYRERILNTIKGRPVDHVPWAPRWDLYFDAARATGRLPERYQGWDIFDVARDIGMGIKHHFKYPWREIIHDVEISTSETAGKTITRYRTPAGTVQEVRSVTPEMKANGIPGLVTKYLIAEPADYEPVLYMLEHTEIVPEYEPLQGVLERIGDDGVALVFTGHCPASCAMLDYMGHERFYYEMIDHPQLLERLLAALAVVRDRTVQIVCDSPAAVASLDGNYDMQMTPPAILKRYFLPYLRTAISKLHAAGKLVSTHCDGNNDKILPLIAGAGFDIIEALTAPPMVRMPLQEAGEIVSHETALWGGVPATLFAAQTDQETYQRTVREMLTYAAQRGRLVLGSGDNVPTDGLLERIRWTAELAREFRPAG